MSGYYDRLGYDECFIESQFARSVGPGNYYLYPGARVNPSYNNKTSVVCETGNGCNRLEQKSATQGYGPEDIAKRVMLEDDLRGTNRIITKCSSGHYEPGNMKHVVAFNPRIQERNLFPTNMNVEYEMGFGNGKY